MYVSVELLDHIVMVCLTLSGSQTVFYSIQTIFTFPAETHEFSNFSISLLILVIVRHFDFCHPSGNEVLSHCSFYLCLLTANDVEHLFTVFLFQKNYLNCWTI